MTVRARVKRPVWDSVTTIPGYTITQKLNSGGTTVNVYLNSAANPFSDFSEALAVAADITNKTIPIIDLTIYGRISVTGTEYDVPDISNDTSARLCFTFSSALYIVCFAVEVCGV